MTDIILHNNSIKVQQKSTRRVSLLQNKSTISSALTAEVPSTFLLINNDLTSNNVKSCVTPSTRPSLSNSIQITSLKSSLKKENNIPATTKKSVRFNFPLTQIMHFYTPPHLDEDESNDERKEADRSNYFDDREYPESMFGDVFLKLFNSLFSSSEYDSNLYHPVIQQHIFDASTNKLTMILPNWPTLHPTRRFITQMVSLENLSWDNERSIIKGRILVHNLAFEKQVTVRMSFNHWQTWTDIDAVYTESSKGDALDRFSFEMNTAINLSYLNRICVGSSCSMAVRYQVNGREFWDNNNGENFNVRWATGEGAGYTPSTPTYSNSSCEGFPIYQRENPVQVTRTLKKESKTDDMKKDDLYCIQLDPAAKVAPLVSEQNQQHPNYLYTSSTQQQISAHFQLYLERKKRSEERQRSTSSGQMTSSSPILTSSAQNEQVLLTT